MGKNNILAHTARLVSSRVPEPFLSDVAISCDLLIRKRRIELRPQSEKLAVSWTARRPPVPGEDGSSGRRQKSCAAGDGF